MHIIVTYRMYKKNWDIDYHRTFVTIETTDEIGEKIVTDTYLGGFDMLASIVNNLTKLQGYNNSQIEDIREYVFPKTLHSNTH